MPPRSLTAKAWRGLRGLMRVFQKVGHVLRSGFVHQIAGKRVFFLDVEHDCPMKKGDPEGSPIASI